MMRWLDFLFPPRADEAILREVRTDAFLALLAPSETETARPRTTALLPFHDERVRAAVHEAKYHGSEKAFELLSATLSEFLRDADVDLKKARLVPVPLGEKRLKERGFNQVEEVVRRVGIELGIPVETGLLLRTRETASQISLPRKEREENMRGAFSAAHPPSPVHTYVVVDDVLTTGATLQAALDALSAGGAANLFPIALAH